MYLEYIWNSGCALECGGLFFMYNKMPSMGRKYIMSTYDNNKILLLLIK